MTFRLIRVVTDPDALADAIDAKAAKQRHAPGREQLRSLASRRRRAGAGRFPVEFERFDSAESAAVAVGRKLALPGEHFEYERA